MKTLKQKVEEINFQPYVGKDSEFVAYEGENGWWLGRMQSQNVYWVARRGSTKKLGGYSFFTDINGYLQPARFEPDRSSYEPVEYGRRRQEERDGHKSQ